MPFKGTRARCSGCGSAVIMAHDYNSARQNAGRLFTKKGGSQVQNFVCDDGKPHREDA